LTFEQLLYDLSDNKISVKAALDEISSKSKMKTIHTYANFANISTDPLNDGQLQELKAIVDILHIIYSSGEDTGISDAEYESLHELLMDMGIPRVSGNEKLAADTKVSHTFTNLRGTLSKIHYLTLEEKRSNKSRKYLDEWIKKMENLYESKTGKKINLNNEDVLLQNKFDGSSAVLEIIDGKMLWITRGDTRNNLAQNVTHIMNIFNDKFMTDENVGIKFEVMCTEENKDKINEFYRSHPYHNSRQIVTSTLISNEPDFKAEYLYPVPLRIMRPGDAVEQIHPDLIRDFPTKICKLGDREAIREFANKNRYAIHDGMKFRTDGVVMTIINPEIQKVLGRDDNVNNFEVAYKFTEEVTYSKVKDVEFYISNFGFITPVLVINDVIMKGNTVNHISLSNKERFDELDLHYGDDVKVLYDIIPYVTIDQNCKRVPNGRKIEFIKECPRCHESLEHLDAVMVRCYNPNCPSRKVGRIYNYCKNLRIQNIGYQTIDILYSVGLLDDGIIGLYKLKKKTNLIEDLEGFGRAKTKKIIREIEAKRKLRDADFFGSLGIYNISIRTFEQIFAQIKLSDLLNMIKLKNWDLMRASLIKINGVGPTTCDQLMKYFKDNGNMSELKKLLKEVSLTETYSDGVLYKGRVSFTGCRPTQEISDYLRTIGWKADEGWSDKETKYLVVPNDQFSSNKVGKASALGIPIIPINGGNMLNILKETLRES
jgi:NAD-dependent DNA ligase